MRRPYFVRYMGGGFTDKLQVAQRRVIGEAARNETGLVQPSVYVSTLPAKSSMSSR